MVYGEVLGVQIGFGPDGAITTLKRLGVDWASADSPLAAYAYQTFNETEWKPFTFAYINGHGESAGFCKPGSNNYSESTIFRPTLTKLLVRGSVQAATIVENVRV